MVGGVGLKAIAIIPARGGSKRLARKNLRPLCGVPLVAWSIRSARDAQLVSDVYVSTDCLEIAMEAKRYGAEVVMRPPEISGDSDRIEAALLHVMESVTADIVVTLQPTSPLREPGLIDRCIQRLIDVPQLRSVLTVRPAGVTWWQQMDYSVSAPRWVHQFGGMQIPQSQYWQPDVRRFSEDGSVFATHAHALRTRHDRRCRPVDLIVNEWSPDIDEESDLRLAESVLRAREGVPA